MSKLIQGSKYIKFNYSDVYGSIHPEAIAIFKSCFIGSKVKDTINKDTDNLEEQIIQEICTQVKVYPTKAAYDAYKESLITLKYTTTEVDETDQLSLLNFDNLVAYCLSTLIIKDSRFVTGQII